MPAQFLRRCFACTAIASLAVFLTGTWLCQQTTEDRVTSRDRSPPAASTASTSEPRASGRSGSDTGISADDPLAASDRPQSSPTIVENPRVADDVGVEEPPKPTVRLAPSSLGMVREIVAPDGSVTQAIADQVLVQFRANVAVEDWAPLIEAQGYRIARRYVPAHLAVVQLPDASIEAVPEAGQRLRQLDGVEMVAANWVLTAEDLTAEDLTPNDALYSQLWGMERIGAPSAWGVSTGAPSVLVGVIDTGVDHRHVELVDHIWSNPREIPNNGLDDDGNGFIDDVHGWDFIYHDNDAYGERYHGTHVAGTIAASGNNQIGVAGVAWRTTIVPIRAMNEVGKGTLASFIGAIDYATTVGCRVTCNSWGNTFVGEPDAHAMLSAAIQRAADANCLFVASAGNLAKNLDTINYAPGGLDNDNIVTVAALDQDDDLASFSNYSSTKVDIAAPGVDILSLDNAAVEAVVSQGYRVQSGTSMATPHVAGAAALLFALEPSLSVVALKALLLDHAEHLQSLEDKVVSEGLLDLSAVVAAVRANGLIGIDVVTVDDDPALSASNNGDGLPNPGEVLDVGLTIVNTGSIDLTTITAALSSTSGSVTIWSPAGVVLGDLATGATLDISFRMTLHPSAPIGHDLGLRLDLSSTERDFVRPIPLHPVISGQLGGQVRIDGTPASGVEVRINGPTHHIMHTDGDGRYQHSVPVGHYRIQATHPSWQPAPAQERSLAPATTSDLTVDFVFTSVSIAGTVTRLPSGTPASGSTVRIKELQLQTSTDANGDYALQLISGSPATLSVVVDQRSSSPRHHPSGIHFIDTTQTSYTIDLHVMDGFYTTLLIEHPDYQLSFAADINAHGQLAGNLADQLLTGPSSPEMPFRFTDLDGDGALDQGELLLIGYLPGFVSARATGINDHGQVVGYTQANSGSFHGWLFTDLNDNNQVDNGELVDLGSLATNKSVFPNALNDLGHVTGYAADATYYSTMFRYADGAIAPIPGAGISTGLGINNHGAIVGDRTTAGQRKAAIFLPQAAYGLSAGLHDPPGEQAVGINDMGAVALLLNDTTGATPIQSAGIWHDGTLTTIPKRIGFSDAKPMDINAAGDIVGLAQGANSTNAHWLWNASGLVDLNQALPPATVFAIYWNKALALNDTGSVALTADFDFSSTPSGESGLLRAALLLVTQNDGTQPNEPPQILTGPSIAPNPVTGTTAHWNISATDPDGDDTALQFSWSTIVKPAHVNAPILSAVGQGLTGTITFSHAGAYRFQVIITDEDGAIANATVDVTVVASPSNLVISPPEVTVLPNSTTALSAQVVDQFGHTVQPQPSVSWSTTIGTLSAMTGAAVDLLAPGISGTGTVTANVATLSSQCVMTVIATDPVLRTITVANATGDWIWECTPSGTIVIGPSVTSFNDLDVAMDHQLMVLPEGDL